MKSNGSERFFVQWLSPRQSESMFGLGDFHYLIGFFDNWSSRGWCDFDIEITGTESAKLNMRMIGFYSIKTINAIHIFSRLACVFALIEENFNYGNYDCLL